jgi:hypothetical protein
MTLASKKPRRWLIFSHAYNVDGRAESLTITDKMPHLVAAGIEPVVLSSLMGARDPRFAHHQFLPWGPAGLRFDLRHVLMRRWGKNLGYQMCIGMLGFLLSPLILIEKILLGWYSQWSWALPAAVRGFWLVRRGDIELIYSTGGVASAHLAAYWVHRLTGCRWIAEVHDPLVVPEHKPKDRQERFLARIEGYICRHASLAWWFTEGALASARQRYPLLKERGLMVLPGAEPPMVVAPYESGKKCVFGHFGSLSDSRSLSPVIKALASVLQQAPELGHCVALEIYGCDLDAKAAQDVAQLTLGSVVKSMGRLTREAAMERMQQMDVLLLVHGQRADCLEHIPAKLYEYFWARRPVLALTHRNSQLDHLVLSHGGWVAPYVDELAIEQKIKSCIDLWRCSGLPSVSIAPVGSGSAVNGILKALEEIDVNQRGSSD